MSGAITITGSGSVAGNITVVSTHPPKPVAAKVAALLSDARDLAMDDTASLISHIEATANHAEGIGAAEGGYLPGVVDLARRFAEVARQTADTMRAIAQRAEPIPRDGGGAVPMEDLIAARKMESQP